MKVMACKYAKYADCFNSIQPFHSILSYLIGLRIKKVIPNIHLRSNRHIEKIPPEHKTIAEYITKISIEKGDKVKTIGRNIQNLRKEHIPKIELAYPLIDYKHIWNTLSILPIKNKIQNHLFNNA